jgi:uncharacterized protein
MSTLTERVAIAIMAKAPSPGTVKTRLCPPLTPPEAAELSRCFLVDKITQVRSLRDVSPAIAFTPESEHGLFQALAPEFELVPQRGADLGARLRGSLDALLRRGHPAALAIDTDTPTLPTEFLQQAIRFAIAPEIDVVVGPTEDGGYYLIGGRAVHRELFDDVPWSTSAVLRLTLERAVASGLRLACLPLWFDVDTPRDLARLRTMLRARRTEGAAKETRRFLKLD